VDSAKEGFKVSLEAAEEPSAAEEYGCATREAD
jgi:hypothetical protein